MDMASGRLLAGLADASFFLAMVGESSNGLLLLLLPVFYVTAAYLTTLAVGCCCTLADCMDLTLDRTGESNGLLFFPPVCFTGEDDSSSNGLPVNTVTSHRNPSIIHYYPLLTPLAFGVVVTHPLLHHIITFPSSSSTNKLPSALLWPSASSPDNEPGGSLEHPTKQHGLRQHQPSAEPT